MSDSILSLESAKIRNYIIPIFLDKKAREFRVEYFSSIDIDREKYNLFTYLHDIFFNFGLNKYQRVDNVMLTRQLRRKTLETSQVNLIYILFHLIEN